MLATLRMVKMVEREIYKIQYHMVFSLSERQKLFQDMNYINYIKFICSEISKRYCFNFDAIATDGDYVHIFIGAAPKYSPDKVMQKIKSIVAREFLKKFPEVKNQLKQREFWSDESYIGTVGDEATTDIIREYIETQGTPEEKESYKQMNLLKFGSDASSMFMHMS
jgi:putative transposase